MPHQWKVLYLRGSSGIKTMLHEPKSVSDFTGSQSTVARVCSIILKAT